MLLELWWAILRQKLPQTVTTLIYGLMPYFPNIRWA